MDPNTDTEIEVESAAPATTETVEEKIKRERDNKILARARKQFRAACTATEFYREQALKDRKFRIGTWGRKSYQWPDGVQEEREANQLPVLTINRMPGFIRQVTNQARQARLRIHVSPVDDNSDPKVAEVLQGIIRNIESASFADRAYNTASDQQAEHGLGFFSYVTEWADEKSFKQRIRVKRHRNPFRIYVGHAEEADFSDANYAFEVTDLDADAYKDEYDEAAPTPSSLSVFEGTGDQTGDWFPNGKVRVAVYFNRETRGGKSRLVQMDDGTVLTDPTEAQLAEIKRLGGKIDRERIVQRKVLVKRVITAVKILEETEWGAEWQPYIPVMGDEYEDDGVKDWRGVVRDSKDSGRVYNVQVTGLVTSVGQGLKAPVIGVVGQFGKEGSAMREAWKNANRKPVAFLEYELVDIDGKPAPRPERNNFDPPLQGQVMAVHQADEDYKTTAGFHDASFGERGPQESGKAIKFRQDQDRLGSSHYLDNLRFALCAGGRQLIQLIRTTMDVPQVIRITGNDERQKKVMVYSGAKNDPRQTKFLRTDANGQTIPFQLPEGVKEIYDISTGEFDVEVSASPDGGTRRQENLEIMTGLFSKLPPEIAMKFLDLYFLVMDLPQARQMAERAKKLIPEAQDEEGEGKPQIPPEVVAKVQQLSEQLQMAMAALQEAQLEIKTERGKIRSQMLMKHEELQSRERIEALKIRGRLLEQRIDIQGQQALTLLQAEITRLETLADQQHETGLRMFDAKEDAETRALEGQLAVLDAAVATTPDPEPAGDGAA